MPEGVKLYVYAPIYAKINPESFFSFIFFIINWCEFCQ